MFLDPLMMENALKVQSIFRLIFQQFADYVTSAIGYVRGKTQVNTKTKRINITPEKLIKQFSSIYFKQTFTCIFSCRSVQSSPLQKVVCPLKIHSTKFLMSISQPFRHEIGPRPFPGLDSQAFHT